MEDTPGGGWRAPRLDKSRRAPRINPNPEPATHPGCRPRSLPRLFGMASKYPPPSRFECRRDQRNMAHSGYARLSRQDAPHSRFARRLAVFLLMLVLLLPATAALAAVAAPAIDQIFSDGEGSFVAEFSWTRGSGDTNCVIDRYQVQYRKTGTSQWPTAGVANTATNGIYTISKQDSPHATSVSTFTDSLDLGEYASGVGTNESGVKLDTTGTYDVQVRVWDARATSPTGCDTGTWSATSLGVQPADATYLDITPTEMTLTEGGSAGTISVSLAYQPSKDVTVNTAWGSGPVSLSPRTLTFTPANYSTAQTVTVTPKTDLDSGTEAVDVDFGAGGAPEYEYHSVHKTVRVLVLEDHGARLIADPGALTVPEGEANSFLLTLSREPSSYVMFNARLTDSRDGEDPCKAGAKMDTVSHDILPFILPDDEDVIEKFKKDFPDAPKEQIDLMTWTRPRKIAVRACQDDDTNNETGTLIVEVVAPPQTGRTLDDFAQEYLNQTITLPVTVIDQPSSLPSLYISPASNLAVVEGDQIALSVVIEPENSAVTTVTIESDSSAAWLSTHSLTIPVGKGDKPEERPIYLTAYEDANSDDETVTLTFTPSGGTIITTPQTRTITINDGPPTVTFTTPASASGNITATFSRGVGSSSSQVTRFTDSTIDALITLKKTDKNGDDIAFDATIRGTVVTINPTSDLSAGTVYVAISDQHWNDNLQQGSATDTTFAVVAVGNSSLPAGQGSPPVPDQPVVVRTPPPALSVADARVTEGPGAQLAFTVSLDRAVLASDDPVSVAYTTRDGTATAGADYTSASGTLTFATGEATKTVHVRVLEDAHGDDGETLELVLSNATGATITDGTGTGTIKNTAMMPRAWSVRFGRTIGTHVTDAVSARLRNAGDAESHLTVAGWRVPLGSRQAQDNIIRQASATESDQGTRLLTGLASLLGLNGPTGRNQNGTASLNSRPRQQNPGQALHLPDLRQALVGSAFRLSLNQSADGTSPRLTAWGRVAHTHFDGQQDRVALDGDVLTGLLGVDTQGDRWLAGIAIAHSQGDGGYTDPAQSSSGDLDTTLTSLHPYLRYALTDRLTVWGLLGYGWGELTLTPPGETATDTDTDFLMGAVGSRGLLLDPAATGGLQIATRLDAMFTRTSTDAVATADMAATDADAHRLRLVLEGSRRYAWAKERTLTPTVEVGVRHDWGDAETGFGVEVGGRVQYADPSLGLTVEGAVRGLVAHEAEAYDEWGASGTVRLAPGVNGQGLALTLQPAWGATASGVEALWGRQSTAGLAPNITQAATGRLAAEVGYGVPAFDTGLVMPYAGTMLAEGAGRTYRVGTRLVLPGQGATGLTMTLEGLRTEPTGLQPLNQGFRLQATWGF